MRHFFVNEQGPVEQIPNFVLVVSVSRGGAYIIVVITDEQASFSGKAILRKYI